MKNARPQTTEASALDKRYSTSLPDLTVAVKADLLNGCRVRPFDYEPEQRPAFWAAIMGLMDCMPIIQRWETLGERHLSGTRIRARVFLIPSEVRKGVAK